jgi:hypothetical protein
MRIWKRPGMRLNCRERTAARPRASVRATSVRRPLAKDPQALPPAGES